MIASEHDSEPGGPAVLFRVDAGPTIGLGHAVRCTTLADAIVARGLRCVFLTAEAEPWRHLHKKRSHEVHVLDVGAPGSAADAEATALEAAALGAERVVIDGYVFGPAFAIASKTATILWLDDLGFSDDRPGLVLNANLYATPDLYPKLGEAQLMLGPSHALLRDDFREHRDRPRGGGTIPRVLVTLGGSDPPDVGSKVLGALELLRTRREVETRILVGSANPRAPVMAKRADVVVGAENVAEHMSWCDVAITAAGGTCLELACLGVPALAIAIADNQRGVADELERRGMMQSLGWHADVTPAAIAAALGELLDDTKRQAQMRERQRGAVDGLGSRRVVERLLVSAR